MGHLRELLNIYHADKIPFVDIYENFFNPIKDSIKTLLEIGIQYGGSLKMWKNYFPKAIIYGIDIADSCKRFEEERIKIFIGDQSNIEFLKTITDAGKSFDIIIDDGSHKRSHQLASFNYLLPFVKSNGFYIIEDIDGTFETKSLDSLISPFDIIADCNRKLQLFNLSALPGDPLHKVRRQTIEESMLIKEVKDLNPNVLVKAIHVFKGIVFFEKL